MEKCILKFLLTVIINTTISIQQVMAADFASQCKLSNSSYNKVPVHNVTNGLPIIITAKNVKGNYPSNVTFTGDVNINFGNSHLQADEVHLYSKKHEKDNLELMRIVDALGNVCYDDSQIILKGAKAWLNLNTKYANIWEGSYLIVGHQGHGKADLIKQRGENRYTILKNGSFTSCLPNSNIWSVVGSEVIYDREEQVAKIWNARFKIGSIPVFYSPYLQLPVGDRRRSGFLIPKIKYSKKNYFDFYIPYYWNITPSMDATITPHYRNGSTIHRHHGNTIWEGEFRYLTQAGIGTMEIQYLPPDEVFKDGHLITEENPYRWIYCWKHSGVVDQVWRFDVNYTKISNPRYFNDFLSRYSSSADSYFTQMFSAGYFTRNFDATISTRQFQVFADQTTNTYIALPQLDVHWYQNNVGPFDMRVYGQVVHFVNKSSDMPEAKRVHLEQSISLPCLNDWASMNAEVKLMTTNYQQKNLYNYNVANHTNFEESVTRTMLQFKVHGNLVLERNINLATNDYIQTLEPHIQYLYVPYRNQSKINKYDSSFIQSDYIGLFRDRIYSGLDRIASANQVTTGVISRIFDDNAIERFSVSIGQIHCFTRSRNGDNNIHLEDNRKTGSLVWSGDTYWSIGDRWDLRGSMQYDACLDSVTTSNTSIEYHRNKDRIVQLTYRYASPEYIHTTLPNYSAIKQYKQGVSQVGGATNWSVADHWSIAGAYYFNTNNKKVVNQKLGLQYSSCCYAIRVEYEHKLNGWNAQSNQSEYDNVIGFNIELRGLSSNYELGSQHVLHSNTLPYNNNSF